MAKHGLNEANVCAVFEHQRGHGVAKQVARALLADVGIVDVAANVFGQRIGFERLAKIGDEQGLFVGITSNKGLASSR